ncbi:PREDICTED: inositol polyphosphate 5-phosphatase K-like isoform X1 [Papilio xuthus]|uniref:Inositol polyphosphate 5-phosphatase K-like isoform X1 n=1 Tax=Papilio xuthus TaxID=66420 RepID=A0AAJ6Z2W8_PAPXU|nr:PREDICTED: inositol polyphosphate 5-phosphatase K-like isoform X1 [Papilio xuthus]
MDTLRFYFVTWNVATKSPGQDLNSLLDFPSQFNRNKPLPDFYVIGLQEVKSAPQNMVMDSLFTDPWTSTFNKILCRQGFIIAKTIRLQGIILIVYTQLKHVTHLRDIEAQYTKIGFGGLWGNKGAVSVRFNIYGCSVCLVNCHLTAHEHLHHHRVTDYNTIVNNHTYHVTETTHILFHDYVFFIGDLNCRLDHPPDESPSAEEIAAALQEVEKDKYAALLKYDQLYASQELDEAFVELTEPEIRFPPTYKFILGTDDYDLKRKPSWTDRILYKVVPNNYENITLRADCLSYNDVPHYTVSDHKPVVAVYTIKVQRLLTRSLMADVPRATRSMIRMRTALVKPADTPEDEAGTSTPDVPEGEEEEEDVCDNVDGVFVSDEVMANYTEKTVEFAPVVRIWYIGDADFRTQCTLSPDVEINPNDWIGIYDADFHNLDDYIAYEYLAKVSLPHDSPESGQARTITLSFPVGSGVRTPGFYRFIYFSQPNNEVRSVLGISDPFEVCSKEDALVTIDPCEQASTSSSSGKPTTATTDLFTDFTGLDVTKLSRHFSNDLSID